MNRIACLLIVLGASLGLARAQMPETIDIRLVTDFESATPISDRESLRPVTETVFDPRGSRTRTLGTDATLWVRNAHVDGTFFFERYYQGKYIGREAKLTIATAALKPGEHVIEPGAHRFHLAEDGALTSDDPNIRIAGNQLHLRCFPVTVYPADDARTGPPELRLVAAEMGLFALDPAYRLDPAALPNPSQTRDPRDPKSAAPLTNLLSHAEAYYPLTVWLPANEVGQGYLLWPSWQAFHVTSAGEVKLSAAEAPTVPGVRATAAGIVIPHRRFSGQVNSPNGMRAGVGSVYLGPAMNFGATLGAVKFRGGFGKLNEDFFLPVDTDFTKRPFKHFVADNMADDREAVRLLALEWERPVYTAGSEVAIGLRFLETPDKPTLTTPTARLRYSSYDPRNPVARDWRPVETIAWVNDPRAGELRFRVPAEASGFVIVEINIVANGAEEPTTLRGELQAAVVAPGQSGSASFISDRARDAFVAGETIDLTLALRSAAARPAGQRQVLLRRGTTTLQRFAVDDNGAPWQAISLRLPAEHTAKLAPGLYELTVDGLPPDIAAVPFRFDLVPRERQSEYLVIKPSKYTRPMNNLVPGHYQPRESVSTVDLDRAMRTLAGLGYNRVDLMTYLTNHHVRVHTWREELAATDPRLPAPAAVYNPAPRQQLLNACVRYGLEFSDVFLSYNDFALPRYIDGYTQASARWFAREIQSMRGSPAMDGMMLYDEMYEAAVSGLVEGHQKLWADIRAEKATAALSKSPAKIQEGINRFVSRPKSQRDPQNLQDFIALRHWEQLGWADWQDRVVNLGRQLAPHARFGTYRRTFMSPGNSDGLNHGFPADLFRNLDIASQVHYADNSTCWVHIPMIARLHRTAPDKIVYANLPITHESRTHWDGQYQRMMAFALLAQGANGISMWGLQASFEDGANPETLLGYETTRHLNETILKPFGDLVNRTADGYGKVGIVSQVGPHAMSEFKEIGVSHQTEEIWVACWRLGYPAVFLRDEDLAGPLTGMEVIFVPGIRFDGELPEAVVKRLEAAIAAGVKVVVERGSELKLPGVIALDDWPLNDFYLGYYFPTWMDDELEKVYETSQASTDYLRRKFAEWGIEPAAAGTFQVGPGWRDGGAIDYLIMANFDDPPYPHTVRQQMAKPVRLPLTVEASRGAVAVDLLRGERLPLTEMDATHRRFTLDLTRMQGGIVAFLPEPVARLDLHWALSADGGTLRLKGTLIGESGQPIDGLFPARIALGEGADERVYYRTLGRDLDARLAIPAGSGELALRVGELIANQSATWRVPRPALPPALLQAVSPGEVGVPYPHEVRAFLDGNRQVRIVAARRFPAAAAAAGRLAERLRGAGIEATIVNETEAYRFPGGLKGERDPLADGFHSWRGGQEVIGPAIAVDAPLILLAAPGTSYLLDEIAASGYLTRLPVGGLDRPVRPSLQVAHRALHWQYDTLCLVASDEAGLNRAIDRLFEPFAPPPAPAALAFGEERLVTSAGPAALPPPIRRMGNNELIAHLRFDQGGNVYAATWGHGNSLYAYGPDGQLRFARYLPQMGIRHLDVAPDRILAFTAAGARLYQLQLDGTPISQVQLNLDPGSTHYRDNYGLSNASYVWLPDRQRLVHKLDDRMRVLAPDMTILAEWESEPFQDKDVSDEWMPRKLFDYAVSPDGTRIAQIEASYYFTRVAYKDETVYDTCLVIRDLDGKLLHEFPGITNTKEVEDRVEWGPGMAGPAVNSPGIRREFDAELKLVRQVHGYAYDFYLGSGRRLVRDGRLLRFLDAADRERCRLGPFATMPTHVALAPDGATLATLDEVGLLRLFGTADGRERARVQVPEVGEVLRFSPDSQRLALGGARGGLQLYDLQAKLLWQARLGDANDVLGQDLPLHDPAIPDLTRKLWPVQEDEPGQLEALVRLGENRLPRSDFRVGETLVTEQITQYLGRHVTWVLEFRYKAVDAATQPELTAGMLIQNDYPDTMARVLTAGAEWRFARLAIKNGEGCTSLAVGFQASGGEIEVADATLRRIRFPSVNHLLYEPLYQVAPKVLTNPLFSPRYDPVGNAREAAPNKVMVQVLQTGAMNLVESAFLQNGRLNDVGSKWYVQPFAEEPTVSLSLREPRWISMVVCYFDAYQPDNVLRHFDIVATDMATREERVVASVRNNRQVFRIVKFPPVETPMVKIRPVNSIKRLRTFTEIELYGPLSGQEGSPGFADAEGQNTYMGNFTRVDRREKALAPAWQAPIMQRQGHGDGIFLWNPPAAQILVADDRLHVSRALGLQGAFGVDKPTERLHVGRANGIGFSPYGALYGGLLLRPGNDGKLYCISPESGTTLWSVKLGERLFGCPVAIREDIYAANASGRLFQLDLANGSIMKDTALPGGVFGSLATDDERIYLIGEDGSLSAWNAGDLTLAWQVPVAPYTDATPAVDGGIVYLADQRGTAYAVNVADGAIRWRRELGQEFARCPVVLPDTILYGCRGGLLVALDRRSGEPRWSRQLATRFAYEPLVLGDRILAFEGSKGVLLKLDGSGEPEPVEGQGYDARAKETKTYAFDLGDDPLVSLSYYQGRVFAVPRSHDLAHREQYINYQWHVIGGRFYVLAPAEPAAEEVKK